MGGHHLSCLVEESEGFRCTSGDKDSCLIPCLWWFWFWCQLHFFTVFFFFLMNILEKHNRFSVFICYKFGFGKFGILCHFFNSALGLWWTFEWKSDGKGRYVLGCALLIQIRIIWAMSMWSVHSFQWIFVFFQMFLLYRNDYFHQTVNDSVKLCHCFHCVSLRFTGMVSDQTGYTISGQISNAFWPHLGSPHLWRWQMLCGPKYQNTLDIGPI